MKRGAAALGMNDDDALDGLRGTNSAADPFIERPAHALQDCWYWTMSLAADQHCAACLLLLAAVLEAKLLEGTNSCQQARAKAFLNATLLYDARRNVLSYCCLLSEAFFRHCLHILRKAEQSPGTKGAAVTAMVLALPGRVRFRLPDGTNGAAVGLKELKALLVFSSWSTMVLRSPSVMAGLWRDVGHDLTVPTILADACV